MNATSNDTAPAVAAETPPAEQFDTPATLVDGRVIDLTIPSNAPDPFIDPCPSWCEFTHPIVKDDSERVHYGREIIIPLSAEPARWFDPGNPDATCLYTIGHARLFWRRNTREREDRVHIGKGEIDDTVFTLTRDEAQQLRDALDALLSDAAE